MYKQYVNMQDILGSLAIDYNIPILELDNLIILAQRTVIVYNLDKYSKQITVAELFDYIKLFVQTPFGNTLLKNLNVKIM